MLGIFNGLVFLPVLLVLVGPPAEVVPNDNGDEIPVPTPEPSPLPFRSSPATGSASRAPYAEAVALSYPDDDGGRHLSSSRWGRPCSSLRIGGGGEKRHHISIPVAPPMVPKRHNSESSLSSNSRNRLSTIDEESNSYETSSNQEYYQYSLAGMQGQGDRFYQGGSPHLRRVHRMQQQQQQQSSTRFPFMTATSSPPSGMGSTATGKGASVFVEPEVVVETTTYPFSEGINNVNTYMMSRNEFFHFNPIGICYILIPTYLLISVILGQRECLGCHWHNHPGDQSDCHGQVQSRGARAHISEFVCPTAHWSSRFRQAASVGSFQISPASQSTVQTPWVKEVVETFK